jgi:hypothetical protein
VRRRLSWADRIVLTHTLGGKPLVVGYRADAQIRTGDPFITSEVLYQLSYVGEAPTLAGSDSNP